MSRGARVCGVWVRAIGYMVDAALRGAAQVDYARSRARADRIAREFDAIAYPGARQMRWDLKSQEDR